MFNGQLNQMDLIIYRSTVMVIKDTTYLFKNACNYFIPQ